MKKSPCAQPTSLSVYTPVMNFSDYDTPTSASNGIISDLREMWNVSTLLGSVETLFQLQELSDPTNDN